MAGWLTQAQEAALVAWLRAATGLGASAVLWAPVPTSVARPARPYMTLQVVGGPTETPGLDERRYSDIDDEDRAEIAGLVEVVERTATPPGDPDDGAVYLVDADPEDDWSGHADEFATWGGSSWTFAPADAGDRVSVTDGGALLRFDGSAWQSETDMRIEQVVGWRTVTIGVQAYSDADDAESNATRLVSRAVTALARSQVHDALRSAGLGFVRSLALRDADALVSAAHESRAACDVVFNLRLTDLSALDVFTRVSGTGTATYPGGTAPITYDTGA